MKSGPIVEFERRDDGTTFERRGVCVGKPLPLPRSRFWRAVCLSVHAAGEIGRAWTEREAERENRPHTITQPALLASLRRRARRSKPVRNS